MNAVTLIAFVVIIVLFVTPLPEYAMFTWEKHRDKRKKREYERLHP